jgi:hypothetical protein
MGTIFQAGCSGRTGGTSTLQDYSGDPKSQGDSNPGLDKSTEDKSVRIEAIIAMESLAESFYYFFPYDSPFFTSEKLIAAGFLAIKPSNPFTGNPMLFSEEYIPGEIYFAPRPLAEGDTGFIRHFDQAEPEYDTTLVQKGEWLQKKDLPEEKGWFLADEYEYFNGQSLKRVLPGPGSLPPDYLTVRKNWGYEDYPDEQLRVMSIAVQMSSVVGSYSIHHEEAPEYFNEYINWLGQENPAAWVNPYSGEVMKQVPIVACATYPDDPNAPLGEMPKDVSPFIGNYAYKLYDNGQYTVSLARFYYLDKDGLFKSEDIVGFPRKAWLNTIGNLGR